MNFRERIESKLKATEAKLKLAVATGKYRDAHQFAGEAVRLEGELAAAKEAPQVAKNIVGRAFVNDDTQKKEE